MYGAYEPALELKLITGLELFAEMVLVGVLLTAILLEWRDRKANL